MTSTLCPNVTTAYVVDTASNLYYEATLIRYIFYHTYPSLSTFIYGFGDCCRIGGLIVGAGQDYDYYGIVSLANGNTGSPVSSISPIVQFTNGIATIIPISPVDNDGDIVTCRKATSTESSI